MSLRKRGRRISCHLLSSEKLHQLALLQVTSHSIVLTSIFSNKCPAPAANLPDELILWVGF